MGITKLTKEIISARMKELKIKQIHIADALGTSTSSVSNWVNGIYKPSGDELPKLLKVLKLSLINGEIVKDDYAGIEVPVINTTDLRIKNLHESNSTYATKEKDVAFIINVNTHNFLFPFGSKLYVKKFRGIADFKSNMFIVTEDNDNRLKISKLTFFNENYYSSCNSDLESVNLKDIKWKISLVKLDAN